MQTVEEVRPFFEEAFRAYNFSVVTELQVTPRYVRIIMPENGLPERNRCQIIWESPIDLHMAHAYMQKMFTAFATTPRNGNVDFEN